MDKYPPSQSVKSSDYERPIRIQPGIYQRVSLTPLWFCLALKHLSYLLNRTDYGFGLHCDNQEMQRLNHLLYMDDIKLYAATHNQLQELLRLTHTFSRLAPC